jgi:hypothetical protein
LKRSLRNKSNIDQKAITPQSFETPKANSPDSIGAVDNQSNNKEFNVAESEVMIKEIMADDDYETSK